mmetsp:Transcript_3983/g.12698  ORF Transcript_3983/g.12698 Transcript_3983/m.12698 type:complete len:278 (+) Transcript_3983:896-1729(+)
MRPLPRRRPQQSGPTPAAGARWPCGGLGCDALRPGKAASPLPPPPPARWPRRDCERMSAVPCRARTSTAPARDFPAAACVLSCALPPPPPPLPLPPPPPLPPLPPPPAARVTAPTLLRRPDRSRQTPDPHHTGTRDARPPPAAHRRIDVPQALPRTLAPRASPRGDPPPRCRGGGPAVATRIPPSRRARAYAPAARGGRRPATRATPTRPTRRRHSSRPGHPPATTAHLQLPPLSPRQVAGTRSSAPLRPCPVAASCWGMQPRRTWPVSPHAAEPSP